MTMSQPPPGELRPLLGGPVTSGELQAFLDMAHHRGRDELEDLDFTSPLDDVASDGPAQRRGGHLGLWLTVAAALAVMSALTIWSVGKLTTGVSEAPHAAPLPAAPFSYTPAQLGGATAGSNSASATRSAAPGARSSSTSTPTVAAVVPAAVVDERAPGAAPPPATAAPGIAAAPRVALAEPLPAVAPPSWAVV